MCRAEAGSVVVSILKMAGVSLPISSSKLLKSRGEAIKGLTMLAYIFFKELIVKKNFIT
jgi:hypothetical protein